MLKTWKETKTKHQHKQLRKQQFNPDLQLLGPDFSGTHKKKSERTRTRSYSTFGEANDAFVEAETDLLLYLPPDTISEGIECRLVSLFKINHASKVIISNSTIIYWLEKNV